MTKAESRQIEEFLDSAIINRFQLCNMMEIFRRLCHLSPIKKKPAVRRLFLLNKFYSLSLFLL